MSVFVITLRRLALGAAIQSGSPARVTDLGVMASCSSFVRFVQREVCLHVSRAYQSALHGGRSDGE